MMKLRIVVTSSSDSVQGMAFMITWVTVIG